MDRDTNNTKQSVDFSFDTISEFDNHINNSIQGYDLLHSLVLQIVKYFAKPNTTVLDIGCTSGKLINEIAKDSSLNGVGYDITDHNFIDGPATEILNKEKTLRKIMHPLTEAENKAMLKKAGFKVIDTFYQSMNFKGYICIK